MKERILYHALKKLDTEEAMDQRIMKKVWHEIGNPKTKRKWYGKGTVTAAAVLLVIAGTAVAAFAAQGNSYFGQFQIINSDQKMEAEKGERTKEERMQIKRETYKTAEEAFAMIGIKNLFPTSLEDSDEPVWYFEYNNGEKSVFYRCMFDDIMGELQFYYSPNKTELDEQGMAIQKIYRENEEQRKEEQEKESSYYITKEGWKCTIREKKEDDDQTTAGRYDNMALLTADLSEGGSFMLALFYEHMEKQELYNILDSIPSLS